MPNKPRNIAVCLCCGAILESKHRHDYQVCPCPNHTSVDGGTDYTRGGAQDLNKSRWVSSMEAAEKLVAEHGPYVTVAPVKPPRIKWYLGCSKNPDHSIKYHLVRTEVVPSEELYTKFEHQYFAMIGPFKSKRGALYKQGHPGCETVWNAERLARSEPNNKGYKA